VYVNPPEGNMTKVTLWQGITIVARQTTNPTARVIAKVRLYSNNNTGNIFFNRRNAKSLQRKGLVDKLFDKHGLLPQIEWLVALP
jgi:hypothetical protein